jgi:hypothetical protein
MDETRVSREHSTRNKAQRKESWRPPELLPVPDPEPGYKFHWVRVSTLNTPDPINLSAKRREGWEPVKASEHPELHLHITDPDSASKDVVVIGGLMLCKTPEEFVTQRNGYYSKQANDQMTAVDNSFMRQSDARMPLFNERKSTTTFGSGK